jgi:hypothetical protein
MDLIADIHADRVVGVEDRFPAPAEFGESGFDKTGGTLRPGIHERPGERAGEGDMGVQPEPARSLRGEAHLLDGPFGARLRVAANMGGGEAIESRVIGGMDGDKLALQMGGQLRHRQAMARGHALYLVAIGVRLRRLGQIEQPAIPGGDLHALIADRSRPAADRVERIERRRVAGELGQEDAWAFHGFHGYTP